MTKESQNLTLRSSYRELIDKHWNDQNSVKYSDLIKLKNKILKIESNESKKFYVYKSFVNWDPNRFESEISDSRRVTLRFFSK